jgi:hypothetical protein
VGTILGLHIGTEPDSAGFGEAPAGLVDPSITPPVNTVLTPPAYTYFVDIFLVLSTNTHFSRSTLGDIDCKELANE